MPRSKDSSSALGHKGRDPSLARIKSAWLLDLDHSQYDLLTVLTYLSSVSTANLTREQIFAVGDESNDLPMLDGTHAHHVACPSTSIEISLSLISLTFSSSPL